MPADPDDHRHPLPGMRNDDELEPRYNSRLPVRRGGFHPLAWVVVAVAMLVATFYALSAVLGG